MLLHHELLRPRTQYYCNLEPNEPNCHEPNELMKCSDWSDPDTTDLWYAVQSCSDKKILTTRQCHMMDGIDIMTYPRLPLSLEEHIAELLLNLKLSRTDCYLGKLTRNIMSAVKEAFP